MKSQNDVIREMRISRGEERIFGDEDKVRTLIEVKAVKEVCKSRFKKKKSE